MSQEAAPATLAFEPAAGLTFKCLRKIPVTEGKSTKSKKAGNLSKNAVITVIESFESNGGGLRVRCSRGWVTARTSNGSKNMEVFSSNADTENDINLLEDLSEMSANMAATKAEKGNESREYRKLCKDYQATASKRRPRTMTMALAERKNVLKETFNTVATPREEAKVFAQKGQVNASHIDLVSAIEKRWEPDCEIGIKKMTAILKSEEPMWSFGCKEVREALHEARSKPTLQMTSSWW
jgi:hypothetical protein